MTQAESRAVVDAGVHCAVPDIKALYPYLSPHWPDYLDASESYLRGPASVSITYPPSTFLATPSTDSSLVDLQRDALDTVNAAVLRCYYGVESMTHPYLAPEYARAVNHWLVDEWLSRDDRLLGSASITPQFTAAAVEEIHRVAEDARFVELLLPARSQEPYGNQHYWPLWEAAAETGLVVGITYGGASGTPPTPVNWMSSFYESYVTSILNFQTQLNSLITCGVFDRWPGLKVVMVVSGWTWIPGFVWRMDAEWKQYKREVPWLEEPPSAYVRRHFRFTTQPADLPRSSEHLDHVLEQLGDDTIGADRLLLFASDYPHRYPSGAEALLARLSPDQQGRVLWENAWDWYGQSGRELPARRQTASTVRRG